MKKVFATDLHQLVLIHNLVQQKLFRSAFHENEKLKLRVNKITNDEYAQILDTTARTTDLALKNLIEIEKKNLEYSSTINSQIVTIKNLRIDRNKMTHKINSMNALKKSNDENKILIGELIKAINTVKADNRKLQHQIEGFKQIDLEKNNIKTDS